MTTGKDVLAGLNTANQGITLAIELGGALVPLFKGLVAKIEEIGQGQTTITFDALVAADNAELQAINQLSVDDLAAVNAELKRLGLATIDDPNPPAPPTAVGPAPGKE